MDTVKVIDASALASYCFDEPEMPSIEQDLATGMLCAPAILYFEMINICWKKCRREPGARSSLLQQFEVALAVPVKILDVDAGEVVSLACDTGLSGYDASYLWLARVLGAPLVTHDVKLRRAALKLN